MNNKKTYSLLVNDENCINSEQKQENIFNKKEEILHNKFNDIKRSVSDYCKYFEIKYVNYILCLLGVLFCLVATLLILHVYYNYPKEFLKIEFKTLV